MIISDTSSSVTGNSHEKKKKKCSELLKSYWSQDLLQDEHLTSWPFIELIKWSKWRGSNQPDRWNKKTSSISISGSIMLNDPVHRRTAWPDLPVGAHRPHLPTTPKLPGLLLVQWTQQLHCEATSTQSGLRFPICQCSLWWFDWTLVIYIIYIITHIRLYAKCNSTSPAFADILHFWGH